MSVKLNGAKLYFSIDEYLDKITIKEAAKRVSEIRVALDCPVNTGEFGMEVYIDGNKLYDLKHSEIVLIGKIIHDIMGK